MTIHPRWFDAAYWALIDLLAANDDTLVTVPHFWEWCDIARRRTECP